MTLARLESIGAFEKQVAFFPADYALLQSPKGVAKIERVLGRCRHPFAFYVVFDYHENRRLRNTIGANFTKWMTDRGYDPGDNINVVLTNNIASIKNYRPLHGWTLIHRLVHCLQIDRSWEEAWLWNHIADIVNATTDHEIDHRTSVRNSILDSLDGIPKNFCHTLLTMKSARDRNLQTAGDVPAELLAQYVVTGQIKLRSAKEVVELIPQIFEPSRPGKYFGNDRTVWRGYSTAEHPSKRYFYADLAPNIDLGRLQAMIDAMKAEIEAKFEELLTNLRGKVIGW